MFTLVVLLASIIATSLDMLAFDTPMEGTGPASVLLSLAIFLPGLTVGVRRLHDRGWSGWWLAPYALFGTATIALTIGELAGMPSFDRWIDGVFASTDSFTPAALVFIAIALAFGAYVIWLLVLWCLTSEEGENRYGPNPYGDVDTSVF